MVGFFDDDPGQPVVLGGLFSSAKAAPITATDDNHQKGFTTRSGMHILFDDDKKTIKIDTPGGNKLMLDDDQKQIDITDQNGNKILLSSDGITLDSAKDVIVKAKGDVKLEGTKGLELKANTPKQKEVLEWNCRQVLLPLSREALYRSINLKTIFSCRWQE